MKTHQLKCRNCDGIMDLSADREILFCPYCGSKELIEYSDDVIIEKIRNESKRQIKLDKIKAREQKRKDELEKEKVEVQKSKEDAKVVLLICAFTAFAFLFCLLMARLG